ncbi:MAG: fdxA 2 [Planctomycetaceae bacterium]|nr:fdxA 2 [Planctomycetaceae bacterium]
MLYIDPTQCISCSACAEECPEHAIFLDDDVPEPWRDFIALNAEMAEICPSITQQKQPLKSKPNRAE